MERAEGWGDSGTSCFWKACAGFPQDHRTFSADPCQADPQPPPLSVRNVRPPFRIRTTHQTWMTTGRIGLSPRIQPWLWGIEFGGFWKVFMQLQMVPGGSIPATCWAFSPVCWPGSQANEGVLLIIGGVCLSSAEEREPCTSLLDFALSSIFVQLHKSRPSPNLIRGPQRAFVSSQLHNF